MSNFARGVAVVGFGFSLVGRATGAPITTGSVTGRIMRDGTTVDALANSPEHAGNGIWKVDLTAAEMDAAVVVLLFEHDDAIPRDFTIKTAGKIDGLTREVWERLLLARVAPGRTELVDHGDGTKSLVYYRQDGATELVRHTFNSQGEWIDVEIND